MPIYLFKDEDNNDVEHIFTSDETPKIGEQVMIDGKLCTRRASFLIDSAGIERKTHKYPYVSRSLCRNSDGCKHTKTGQPIITSQKHEREVAARHDMVKDQVMPQGKGTYGSKVGRPPKKVKKKKKRVAKKPAAKKSRMGY